MGSVKSNAEYFEVPLDIVNVEQYASRATQATTEQNRVSIIEKAAITIKEYTIFLLANPRSGSQRARHFLRRYANLDNKYDTFGDTKCEIKVLDVINQRDLIAQELENAMKSTCQL